MAAMQRSVAQVGLFPTLRDITLRFFALPASDISTSGVQLFVLGVTVAVLRHVVRGMMEFVRRVCVSRCEVESREEAFAWVQLLVGERRGDEALQFTVSQRLSSARNSDGGPQEVDEGFGLVRDDGGRSSGKGGGSCNTAGTRLNWIPAPGMHLIWYRSRPILVRRSVNGETGQSLRKSLSNEPSERLETMTLTTLATSPALLHSLIEDARASYLKKDRSRTVVFTGTQYGGWQRLHSRPIRPLNTVIMSPSVLDPLLADIRGYLLPRTEKWYAERGIPYRRGYLFSGPPGTGKTSLAVGLAGEFKLGVYVVSLAGKGMNDDTLIELLGNMPRRSILLLEDIDVAFPNRAAVSESKQQQQGENASGVTSSGLLNALDGVAAQEGRIVILTTNFVERLDAALIRPGRVDMSITFSLATCADCRALFLNFFGDENEEARELGNVFAKKAGDRQFSIANLQGFLMNHKDDPFGAVQHVDAWVSKKN